MYQAPLLTYRSFFGGTIAQVFYYFQNYPKDKLRMKLFVSPLVRTCPTTHTLTGRSSVVRRRKASLSVHCFADGLGSILDVVKEVNVCYVSIPYGLRLSEHMYT